MWMTPKSTLNVIISKSKNVISDPNLQSYMHSIHTVHVALNGSRSKVTWSCRLCKILRSRQTRLTNFSNTISDEALQLKSIKSLRKSKCLAKPKKFWPTLCHMRQGHGSWYCCILLNKFICLVNCFINILNWPLNGIREVVRIWHVDGKVFYLIFVGALDFEFVAPPLDQILTTSEQLCKVP